MAKGQQRDSQKLLMAASEKARARGRKQTEWGRERDPVPKRR